MRSLLTKRLHGRDGAPRPRLRDFVVEMPGGHRLALGERIIQSR
jgi:hypothetical protein